MTASSAKLGDVVWVGDATWFVIYPELRDRKNRALCRLVDHTLTCSIIPNSGDGVHLVESNIAPLIAMPDGPATRYVEPFTWKTLRRLEGVRFDQHAVVFPDRTMWIEESNNLLVAPPSGQPRRWFAKDVSAVAVSTAGALWVEYRGKDPAKATAIVRSAMFVGDQLDSPRDHVGIQRWTLGREFGLCMVGSTIGVIESLSRDLVRFELDSDRVTRTFAGDVTVRCGPGVIAATPLAFTDSLDRVSWCDRTICRSGVPGVDGFGAFAPIDRGVLAVGSTVDRLVTVEVGKEPEYVLLPANNSLSMASATALADGGALVQFIYGEVFAFDRDGRPRPLRLQWLGTAPTW